MGLPSGCVARVSVATITCVSSVATMSDDMVKKPFVACQLAPHRRPHHPVLVHRLAPLIHASFRPRLTTTPLRFSSPSPPPGWAGDFHPLAVEHVRHTKKSPASRRGPDSSSKLEARGS